MELTWEPGSDLIGDFVWPGGARVVVKKSVFDALAKEFRGFHQGPVTMWQDPKLKRPTRPNRRTKPRIWLPYTGPELVALWPERYVPYLPSTTFVPAFTCEHCGHQPMNIAGRHIHSSRWDPEKGVLVPDDKPRIPGMGVFVSSAAVGDTPIFRLDRDSGPIAIADEVKQFIESKGYTNIEFGEYGDIVDP